MSTSTSNHFPDAGKMIALEDDVKPIRDALAGVPSGWNLDAAQAGPEGKSFIGCTLDGEFYPVVTVDTGNYDQATHSARIADFYAAANPARIARLIAHMDAETRRADALAATIRALRDVHSNDADQIRAVLAADPDERLDAQALRLEAAERDAARYQLLRRGQHWSVIDGIGDPLRAEVLDEAIDTQRAAIASEAGK